MSHTLSHIPPDILVARDYEQAAHERLEGGVLDYIAGASGDERTLRANTEAFTQTWLSPRLLRAMKQGHTQLNLLGQVLPHPILLAPVAYQKLVHPQGEIASAQAATAMDTCFVTSTLSSIPLEDIAQAASRKWFQLYFQPDRAVTLDLVRRAERAGYSALVVTLDTTIKAPSLRLQRRGFALPNEIQAVNLDRYPPPPTRSLNEGDSVIFQGFMADAPTWDDLAWLMSHCQLPVVVKGVLRADDAQALQAMGVAAQVVSNHGGRALDGVPASLSVLPAIRVAVGTDYPLLLDSGIRSGSDIFKAIALGANAVLIGRLQVYALAVAGALGVAHLMRTLREELELCMAQAGCATLADITPDLIHSSGNGDTPC